VNDPLLVGLCAALGVLVAAAWRPLVPWFGARSADSLPQPGWTERASSTPVLAPGAALLFAAAAARFGATGTLVPALLLAAILVGVIAIDLRYRIVPDTLVAFGTLAGLAVSVAVDPSRWLELVLATVAGCVFLFLPAVVSPAGLGLGDAKLAGMLGAFLGWSVLPALVAGLVLASVPSVAVLASRGLRRGARTTFALGPFLALGGVVGLLFGPDLVHWYVHAARG
jgi:leader peptidase (prepilin peptidase)/N-methyltransferase